MPPIARLTSGLFNTATKILMPLLKTPIIPKPIIASSPSVPNMIAAPQSFGIINVAQYFPIDFWQGWLGLLDRDFAIFA
jgi:hypothetical protein